MNEMSCQDRGCERNVGYRWGWATASPPPALHHCSCASAQPGEQAGYILERVWKRLAPGTAQQPSSRLALWLWFYKWPREGIMGGRPRCSHQMALADQVVATGPPPPDSHHAPYVSGPHVSFVHPSVSRRRLVPHRGYCEQCCSGQSPAGAARLCSLWMCPAGDYLSLVYFKAREGTHSYIW